MWDDDYRGFLWARGIADCENEEFWSGLFEDLKGRGLTGVQLVSSPMGTLASRKLLRLPSSAHSGRHGKDNVLSLQAD